METMDHAEAIKLGAVERYLLDELAAHERGRFEEHYFSCPACAEDVKITAVFLDNLRATLNDPYAVPVGAPAPAAKARAVPLRPFWLQMGMAAAIVLLAIVGYQNTVMIPGMRRELARAIGPQAYAHFFVTQDRSPVNNALEVPAGTERVSLNLSTIPNRTLRYYRCVLKDDSGRSVTRFSVPAPKSEEWELSLPITGLSSGAYVLDVSTSDSPDGAAQPLAQYHFQLVIR